MTHYYVLTSRRLGLLVRALETIPKDRVTVVINSRREGYEEQAVNWCIENDIEYVVTECDGTPATGKNSVIKLFLESDHDYMVQLDGDDIITREGVKLYDSLPTLFPEVDCVALYKQTVCEAGKLVRSFDKSDADLKVMNENWYFFNMHAAQLAMEPSKRLSIDRLKYLAEERVKFNNIVSQYSENKESLCRLTYYSKKGASLVNFDNSLTIGEDMIQFFKLKYYSQLGLLNMYKRSEKDMPSYIYMADDAGTVDLSDISWVPLINQAFYDLKEKPDINYSLPELGV